MPAAHRNKRSQLASTPKSNHNSLRESFRGWALWICFGLILVNIAVYQQTVHFGFASLDDPSYVSENPVVAGGLNGHSVIWAFTTGHAANWHPLTWLSHMVV